MAEHATIEKIVDQIGDLSALDLSKLVKALEEKFGVSAAAPMMAMAPAGASAGGAAAAEAPVVPAAVEAPAEPAPAGGTEDAKP